MSLSSHLQSKDSPVREWLEEHFPQTRIVGREANRELRGAAATCLIPRPDGADPGLVGGAIDYLLRACLRVTSINRTAASVGVQMSAQVPSLADQAITIEREAVQRIRALRPSRRDLDDAEWTELCTLCLVLARFEQFYRTGGMSPAVFDLLVQPLAQCQELDEFIPLTLTPPSITDLEHLGRAAWEDHRDLRKARPLNLNPDFALSAALGGADADLIARGLLLDWKATTTENIIGREQLWQLLGYALADTDDKYGIREVGIAALRWRSIKIWPMDELLADLTSSKAADYRVVHGNIIEIKPAQLSTLRRDFARVVKAAREAEITRREAWLAKWGE